MPTLYVIDSNYLTDPALAKYLRSPENMVVLCDQVGLELFKATDPILMICRSFEPLMKSAGQAIVLRRTIDLQRTPGAGRKYSPAMFDVQTSACLAAFYRQVTKYGDTLQTAKEIDEKRVEAITLAANALATAEAIVEMFPEFHRHIPQADAEMLRKEGKLSAIVKDSVKAQAAGITRDIHKAMEIPHDLIVSADLMHAYTFRFATTVLVRLLRWFRQGARPTNLEKIRNDSFDCGVVTYATYFDGLLTRDKNARITYDEVTALLDDWYGVNPGKPGACVSG